MEKDGNLDNLNLIFECPVCGKAVDVNTKERIYILGILRYEAKCTACGEKFYTTFGGK